MELKKGWVSEPVNSEIIRIGTPYVRPDGERITFYMTAEWLVDEHGFWFEVQSRFENELDIAPQIKEVLAKYDRVYFDGYEKKVYCERLYRTDGEIYNFGKALNALYQIKFESEVEDGK